MSGMDRDPSYLPPQAQGAISSAMEWSAANYRLVWTLVISVLVVAIYWKSILKALTPSRGAPGLSRDKDKFERMREARFKQQEETERALKAAAKEQRKREAEKKALNPVTEKASKKSKKPAKPPSSLGPPRAGGPAFQPLTGAGTRPFRPTGFRRPRRGG